jgi:hypothetical protein
MAYLTYGELKREIIGMSGHQISDLAAGEFLKQELNRLVENHSWSTLHDRSVLATMALKNEGTVTLTTSTTVTGIGTAFASADIGSDFRVSTEAGYYRITGVAGQVLTLARPYAGPAFTAVSYVVFRRIYALASDFRHFLSIPFNRKLTEITVPDLDRLDPERIYFGDPYRFAYRGVNSAGVTQVELHPIPSTVMGLPYSYVRRVRLDLNTQNTFVVLLRSDVLTNLAAAEAMEAKAIELAEKHPQTAQMLLKRAERCFQKGKIAEEEARQVDLMLAGPAPAVRDVYGDAYRDDVFSWDHDVGL